MGWPGGVIPEIREGKDFGFTTDWYCLGHYVYSALNGHKFMNFTAKEQAIPTEEHISIDAKDIIKRLTD